MNKKIVILFIFSFMFGFNSMDSTKQKQPHLAWKFGLVPGLGQIYNQQYSKALFYLSAQGYSLYKINEYSRLDKIGNRNTYVWWLFGMYILSIIDAYVEAHLSTFPVKNEIEKE